MPTFSDVDENAGTTVIVVPVTAMAAMLNKRVMMMMTVVPALVVVIISQGARGTGGDEENGQGEAKNIFWKIFHFPQYTGKSACPLWGLDPSRTGLPTWTTSAGQSSTERCSR